MKSILLTTTALVAFAGAAVADGHTGVSFSGDFTLGFNDDSENASTPIGDNNGFYWEGDLNVAGTMELDNGVTAGVTFEFDIVDQTTQQTTISDLFVLSLTTETAGLYFGDTEYAAFSRWKAAGDMEADFFSEQDGETVLRGDVTVAGVGASVSYQVGNQNVPAEQDANQLSIGAAGDVGMFSFSVAYQEEADYVPESSDDFNSAEVFGVSVGTAVAGATLRLAYASNETTSETSSGIQVSYPFGPVTGTVYYVSEDDNNNDEDNYGVTVAYADGPFKVTLDYDYDQGVNKVGLDGAYDLGNGLTILAGVFDQSDDTTVANNGTDTYVAASYDLGGGAALLVSYADAEVASNIADDEIGGPDYQVGTTVEVSFSF